MKVELETPTKPNVHIILSHEEAMALEAFIDDNDYGSYPVSDYVGMRDLTTLLHNVLP